VLDPTRLEPFFLYESVYPVVLEHGLPRAQHMIVYLYGRVDTSEITVRLQRSEIDAAAYSLLARHPLCIYMHI
jgi:hypothetical protein